MGYQPQRLSSYPHNLLVVQRGINTEFSHFKFGWWIVYFSLEWKVIIYLPKNHLFVLVYITLMSLMPPFLSHTCHHSSPLFPAPYPQFSPQNSTLLQLSWAPRLSRVVILIQMAYSSHHLADGQGWFKRQYFSLPCIVKRQQLTGI